MGRSSFPDGVLLLGVTALFFSMSDLLFFFLLLGFFCYDAEKNTMNYISTLSQSFVSLCYDNFSSSLSCWTFALNDYHEMTVCRQGNEVEA
jgi:hypothetical protein